VEIAALVNQGGTAEAIVTNAFVPDRDGGVFVFNE
jgi:hypothetical protein